MARGASAATLALRAALRDVGYASGQIPGIKGNLVLRKQVSVIGVSFHLLTADSPQVASADLDRLCETVEHSGLLHPEVMSRYPFAQVVDVLKLFAERKVIGKPALRI